ncbi:MAG: sigma-70 family RNA polymerase sigma factor [Phycisphaerae bacterium]|nr:sigma-70 family RNA polymerase sigma factor [Phycisphaerae bacterium]
MSTSTQKHQVTQLLDAISDGDSRASAELLPLIYDELRKLAQSYMAKEAHVLTLQPTALVHEAYLRLVGQEDAKWSGRGHFFGAAAQAMRRILVDQARSRGRIKRGGGAAKVELHEGAVPGAEGPSTDFLALDEALDALEKYDQRKFQVVMMQYFAGLSVDETAAALGLSATTVRNDWTFARAWLMRQMGGGEIGARAGSSSRGGPGK